MTTGSKFVIRPRMTVGHFRMNDKKGATLTMYVMFEIAPTTATGMDQKIMVATIAEIVRISRIVRVFHVIARFDQTTSPGTKPMKRGLM